jgi:hypothetical protein
MHIGAMTMRFGSVTLRKWIGWKRALVMEEASYQTVRSEFGWDRLLAHPAPLEKRFP